MGLFVDSLIARNNTKGLFGTVSKDTYGTVCRQPDCMQQYKGPVWDCFEGHLWDFFTTDCLHGRKHREGVERI